MYNDKTCTKYQLPEHIYRLKNMKNKWKLSELNSLQSKSIQNYGIQVLPTGDTNVYEL